MSDNNEKKTWTKVGELKKSKAGKLYIQVMDNVSLTKGSNLFLQDPRAGIKESVANGRLTEEKGNAILEKIPEYVKYNVFNVG